MGHNRPVFRSRNTAADGQAASEQARVPLGRMLSRQLLSEADVPAPPKGYRIIRFRTDSENKRGATETVSLDREGDSWKVVGLDIKWGWCIPVGTDYVVDG
ncbi:DUF4019 domain-containing protein [Sphingomonas sp. MJ1 (PH-R8)]|uniref:DUF4019 domain-containing protein n=1 Tax=Sphingomonas sp. MJ1 (PH-R8) TaxID=3112950 RepID=UPI003A83A1C5